MVVEPLLFAKFAEKFGGAILGIAGRARTAVTDALSENFAPYYEATISRCSNIRTLISRDESIPIDTIYVPTYLSKGGKTINEDDFVDAIPRLKSVIICGTGGCGKSVFMRHLFLALANGTTGALPIFVELRGINSLTSSKIMPYVYHTVLAPGATITEKQFERGVKDGALYLILDGFDEVSPEHRAQLESELIELQRNNPKMVLIVTSRHDERFSSWQNFSMFSIVPMKKKEVVELIKKLPYSKAIRNKFAEAVKLSLYQKHESFLSNPLLTTMMLITYEQFAQIPDKVHIFYEQAFETLFFRHDTLKEAGFERKRHVDLAINEFKNALSSLCITTYVKASFQFSESEILESIQAACKHEKLDTKPSAFLRDLIESVCILQRDGTQITFTHRSFQEYFSAFFISRSPSIDLAGLLDRLSLQPQDNVIVMALDINREREWILPRLRTLVPVATEYDSSKPISFATDAIGTFQIRRAKGGSRFMCILTLTNEKNFRFPLVLRSLYPKHFEGVFEPIRGHDYINDSDVVIRLNELKRIGKKGVKSAKDKNIEGVLSLKAGHDQWISSTNIGVHFERFRVAILAVAKEVEKSVRDAESSGRSLVLLK
jgi:NACHT domain